MSSVAVPPVRGGSSPRRPRIRGPLSAGFGISLGVTVLHVGIFVLLPLIALFLRARGLSLAQISTEVSSARVLAALRLSVGASVAAGIVNVFIGTLLAWVLVRYEFPGRRLMDALIDLPFALPTAVAGIALTSLYGPNGLIGSWLAPLGVEVAYTPLGIGLALVFVGIPFSVRSVQPVLASLEPELEEAAAVLGARPFRVFRSVLLPPLLPAICSGFTLAVARGLGEYGSVVFISGNMPYRTEILPLLIVTRLDEFDVDSAVILALLMLFASVVLLVLSNGLRRFTVRGKEGHER